MKATKVRRPVQATTSVAKLVQAPVAEPKKEEPKLIYPKTAFIKPKK